MTALPVAKVVVDLGMAGTAKAHQIVPCMSAALRDGNDVVYLIHRSQPSFLQTHLTERMRRSIRQRKCVNFISPLLAQSIKSEIGSVEQNISKMLFKLSVEQSIVNNLIASQSEIDEDTMERLRNSCAEEVARFGGVVTFEDAYEWQHGE